MSRFSRFFHISKRLLFPHFLISPFSHFLLLLLLACSSAPSPTRDTWIEAISHKNLGLAYLDRADLDGAVAEFDTVCALIPDDPTGYANLALTYLRRQEIDEAERAIDRAVRVARDDGEVRTIQADVYIARGNQSRAVEVLEEALRYSPTNVAIRYKHLKLARRLREPGQGTEEYIAQLRIIAEQDTGNVAVLAELGEALVRAGQYDDAATAYRAIEMQLIPMQEDIRVYFDATMKAITEKKTAEVQRNASILGNILKADPTYRASRDALADPSRPYPPLYDFRTAPPGLAETTADSLIDMRFTEATKALFDADALQKLPRKQTHDITLADYDADGRLDLAITAEGRMRLFHNEDNRWVDVTRTAGLGHITQAQRAVFGDIDNDGDQDLYIMQRGRDALYRYEENGKFASIRRMPFSVDDGIGDWGDAVFADYDHDGDLDILLVDAGRLRIYRNVGDGVFNDATDELVTRTGPETKRDRIARALRTLSKDIIEAPAHLGSLTPLSLNEPPIAYGDFDQDGALDLFITKTGERQHLLRNLRQGKMGDWTKRFGLEQIPGVDVAVADDFNNDGAPDLFLAGREASPCVMLWNNRDGTFDTESTPASLKQICGELRADAAIPLDFDNDGFLDLAVGGMRGVTEKYGIGLIRNLGNGRFEDASSLLPEYERTALIMAIDAGDVDSDGDIDLVMTTGEGVTVLRNDGGNTNRWLDVQLAAALMGSSKNNFYGIGATIELNTETHYQSRIVTSPVTHFGLGRHDNADVMRVIWPNGVPQNRVKPETNTRIVEQQRLKGSCPSLYTWDGEKYTFVTHLMTRSAIGALSDTGDPAYPDAADDYVKIRGDQLREKDGKYTLRIVEELWDAVYMDALQMLVVDHPETTDIYVDEKYVPPPYPDFRIITATRTRLPRTATDHHGHDILPHLTARDSLYTGDFTLGTYQGLTEPHAITLDLGDLSGAHDVRLYLCGWIMPIEPSSNLALAQRGDRHAIAPYLEVPDAQGRWQRVIDYTGFPSGEHKTMVVDLTGKFPTDDYRVRITTNLQIYWSEAFFTADEPADAPLTITRLTPEDAQLHYRGFSREYQDTPYGPFLRDYSVVSTAPQWLPFEGYRTRYGDVTSLFQASDDRYAIFSSGEEVAVTFDATQLPRLPEGWTRDYVLYSDGWLKEGDLNTDTAATIEPLPFHGMSRYPYGPNEHYPVTPEYQVYQDAYNTRWVSQAGFRMRIRRIGNALAEVDNTVR